MTPREEAKAAGLKRYRGAPCIRCGGAERLVRSNRCAACAKPTDPEKAKERTRQWREANPARSKQNSLRWQRANPQRYAELQKEYREANREKASEYSRARYADNPERGKAYARKWKQENPDKVRQVNRDSARKIRAEHPERVRASDKARREKRAGTAIAQLRVWCSNTAHRLHLRDLNHSRLRLLGYAPDEWRTRLESTLPAGWNYETAKAHGWHIDHIAPIAQVLDFAGGNVMLAFVAAMRLENLAMLPAAANLAKSDDPAPAEFVNWLLTKAKEDMHVEI